jgi:thioredoxin 1
MNAVTHATRQSFDREVLDSLTPVLVDFYADWCGPCRMLAPTLERLAAEFRGRVKIVKVNVDQQPELAEAFQVASIPTLIFFANGKLVGRTSGLVPEAGLRNALNQLAGPAAAARRVG